MDQATRYIPVKAFRPFMESNAVHEINAGFSISRRHSKAFSFAGNWNVLFGTKN
jgi:hypothetical protein